MLLKNNEACQAVLDGQGPCVYCVRNLSASQSPHLIPPHHQTYPNRIPPRHPVMRSSPDVKVTIPVAAGRKCAGALSGPCSSQSGAATVGLGCRASRGSGFQWEELSGAP